MKHFGDFRRVLNELQKYLSSGKIDGILSTISEINVSELVNYLKNKKFSEMRNIVETQTWIQMWLGIQKNYMMFSVHI